MMIMTLLVTLASLTQTSKYEYPEFTSTIKLTGTHKIDEISMEGSLSNSKSEIHCRPIPFKITRKFYEIPFRNELREDVCSEEITWSARRIDSDTLLDITFTHHHNAEEHLRLLGKRKLTIKTDKGIFQESIEPTLERRTPIKFKTTYDDIRIFPHSEYVDQRFVVKTSVIDSYLVEFNYIGRGKIKFYAEPKLETESTWKSLPDLDFSTELEPSMDKFKKCRKVIHAGGNELHLRWMDASEANEYDSLIYGITVKPYLSGSNSINP